MDFDYYFKKYDEEYSFNDSELYGFEIGFEAGQQSKQEEVNKLQAQLDKLQEEIDVLKKRIDKALELLNEFNCPQEYDVEDVWKAASILSGENIE